MKIRIYINFTDYQDFFDVIDEDINLSYAIEINALSIALPSLNLRLRLNTEEPEQGVNTNWSRWYYFVKNSLYEQQDQSYMTWRRVMVFDADDELVFDGAVDEKNPYSMDYVKQVLKVSLLGHLANKLEEIIGDDEVGIYESSFLNALDSFETRFLAGFNIIHYLDEGNFLYYINEDYLPFSIHADPDCNYTQNHTFVVAGTTVGDVLKAFCVLGGLRLVCTGNDLFMVQVKPKYVNFKDFPNKLVITNKEVKKTDFAGSLQCLLRINVVSDPPRMYPLEEVQQILDDYYGIANNEFRAVYKIEGILDETADFNNFKVGTYFRINGVAVLLIKLEIELFQTNLNERYIKAEAINLAGYINEE